MPELKTDAERLNDANEIVRKLLLEKTDLRRTIKQMQREEDTAEKIRQEIWNIAEHNPEPPEWLNRIKGSLGKRGCPITTLSDIHHGEVIKSDQVNGVNEFNAEISARRIHRYFDTVEDLAYNHMGRAETKYPGIIMCMGGDMIGGNIHEELAESNDRTSHQAVNDLTDLLAGGIEQMASAFGRVYVPCVVGNHGRSTKKMRMKNRVFHNYDWSIYCNLARFFRGDKHIRIDVPNSADAFFTSYGTRYMVSHGDSLGVKGGDGIIGAIGPIMRGSIKVGTQQMQMGHDFDMLVIHHWHQMLWLPRVIVNNALKGYDEYASLQLRAPYSRPSQALWFNHPEHGITARWEVFLEGKACAAEQDVWVSWRE